MNVLSQCVCWCVYLWVNHFLHIDILSSEVGIELERKIVHQIFFGKDIVISHDAVDLSIEFPDREVAEKSGTRSLVDFDLAHAVVEVEHRPKRAS